MNSLHKRAIELLRKCTFAPATNAKRFVRDMTEKSEDYELSEKQTDFLWKLVWQYRKQHRNKWFTYFAKDKVAPDKPQPIINWIE